jgi:hypothetical protein
MTWFLLALTFLLTYTYTHMYIHIDMCIHIYIHIDKCAYMYTYGTRTHCVAQAGLKFVILLP